MKNMIQIVKRRKLLLILLLLLIIKLLIVQVQPIEAEYTLIYDDQLMCELANNIADGNWLGEYNKNTLIKGVFTPLFIAFCYIIHIPFLLGKEIFYGIACIVFTLFIRKKLKTDMQAIIVYMVLLFNPVEYSTDLCRLYRDGIYSSLILYLISFFIGIFLNRTESAKKQIKYYIAIGITYTCTYLCREETIWLLPIMVATLILIIIPIIKEKNKKEKLKKIAVMFIPICIFLIITNIIAYTNYRYYGVYTLNQYWGKEFKEAYGALTRVIPEERIRRVPVTKNVMEKIYKISPKFAELKEFFNGENGKKWQYCGENIQGEINAGYFHWALMEAVESKGYYKDAKTANEFYKNLSNEINLACDNGEIESLKNQRNSNMVVFSVGDIIDVIKNMPKVIQYQYNLKNIILKISPPIKYKNSEQEYLEIKNKFERITRTKEISKDYYKEPINSIRLSILNLIKNIYQIANMYLFYIGIAFYIVFIIYNLKRLKTVYEELMILTGLLGIYLSRIFIISFTEILMYREALNVAYLSSIYNIQFLFTILTIIWLKNSTQIHKSKGNKNGKRINNTNSSTK